VPEDELRVRVEKVIRFLTAQGAERVAVACNAGSTVIPDSPNVTGVIGHSVSLVMKVKPRQIAIAGGKRTIESNQYKTILENKGMTTVQQVAQKLSAHIEAGDISSKALDRDIAEIFGPIKNMEYILLACTHYPAIADRIKKVTSAHLLDPAEEMAAWILENWKPLNGNSTVRWITSGDAEGMKRAARNAFGVEINNVEKKEL
jgi:glutamate racemase